MHKIKLFLLLLLIPLAVFAAPATKTKVVLLGHVTTRVSGEPVVVTGYKFYVSKTLGTYPATSAAAVPESASVITASLPVLIPPPASGTYYVVATSYISGNIVTEANGESAVSNAVPVYAVGDGTFFPWLPWVFPDHWSYSKAV